MLVDYEYLVESNYIVATPGPRIKIDKNIVAQSYEALTTGNQIKFDYYGHINKKWVMRHVHPQGLVVGWSLYLIALSDKALQFAKPIWYRLDRIRDIVRIQAPSVKDENFDLAAYAKRAYGAFYSDEEYQEVEWRFAPEATNAIRNFRFHPDQTVEENPDGSLTIRFKAAGWYEMAWALYPWGKTVEVIKPAGLRKLVQDYQRSDIPVLP